MKTQTLGRCTALLVTATLLTTSFAYAENGKKDKEHKNNNGKQYGQLIAAAHTPQHKQVQTPQQSISITDKGAITLTNAKVTTVGSSTLTVTETWGNFVSTWNIATSPQTQFVRKNGGASSIAEIAVGDYLTVKGSLDTTQSVPTVSAKHIKDTSIQKVNASFSGTITSVAASTGSTTSSFLLTTKSHGTVTVLVSPSTKITIGNTSTTSVALTFGQTISRAHGVWNSQSNTLQAQGVQIYENRSILNKRVFEGTVITAPASTTTLPATFSFRLNNNASSTYTVSVAANTTLLSKRLNPINLNQIGASNALTIYGAVDQNNTSLLNAYMIKNTSVQ